MKLTTIHRSLDPMKRSHSAAATLIGLASALSSCVEGDDLANENANSSTSCAIVSSTSTSSSESTTSAGSGEASIEAIGLRADAPPFAVHGPHWVGFRALEAVDPESGDKLAIKAWYPATNPAKVPESIAYPVQFKFPQWQGLTPALIYGHSLADAPVDTNAPPFPIVVFSHGYGLNPEWYAPLVEHYASLGMIVLAPEHHETDWLQAHLALFDRPKAIKQTLDFAERLQDNGGDFAGHLNLSKIAVAGHSFGGYTALALGGAQFDLEVFRARCSELEDEDPRMFLCAPFLGQESVMAEKAGLPAVPDGLWPSLGDSRVGALIAIAGDAYLFNEKGLAAVQIPTLAMGGTMDFGTPWEWGAKLAYDHVASTSKSLVGLTYANHMIAATTCENIPWSDRLDPFEQQMFCYDPVWDRARALDLINHFTSAFLQDTLQGRADAHAALLGAAGDFPGIQYSTTIER
jgi:predicted dienelactone hydrolase